MKRCLASPRIRDMKIKTIDIFFYQIAKIQKYFITYFQKVCREVGILINYWWEQKMIKTNVKGNLATSRKLSCAFTLSVVNSNSRNLSGWYFGRIIKSHNCVSYLKRYMINKRLEINKYPLTGELLNEQ